MSLLGLAPTQLFHQEHKHDQQHEGQQQEQQEHELNHSQGQKQNRDLNQVHDHDHDHNHEQDQNQDQVASNRSDAQAFLRQAFQYTCPACDFTARIPKQVRLHLQDSHVFDAETTPDYRALLVFNLSSCSYCQKLFSTSGGLTRHLASCRPPSPAQDRLPCRPFDSQDPLSPCWYHGCDARLAPSQLRDHLESAHPCRDVIDPPPPAFLAPLDLMTCPHCLKLCRTQRGIINHARGGCAETGQTLAQIHGARPNQRRRCWVWWQALTSWHAGHCTFTTKGMRPKGQGIVLDTLYVKVDYDDHDSSFELIGRLSFSDPATLPGKQPSRAPSEPSLDFPVQLSDNSPSPDPPNTLEPSLVPAEPDSPETVGPLEISLDLDDILDQDRALDRADLSDDSQATPGQWSDAASEHNHSCSDSDGDGDSEASDPQVDRPAVTVDDDPFQCLEGGLCSDWPRFDTLPTCDDIIPTLRKILLRKKVVSRLPPPDQWTTDLKEAFVKAACDFAPYFHKMLTAEPNQPGLRFNQLTLELLSFPTKVLLAYSNLRSDLETDPQPPDHHSSDSVDPGAEDNEPPVDPGELPVLVESEPDDDGEDTPETEQSADADAHARWIKRATKYALNEELGRAAKEFSSHGTAPQTLENFHLLKAMCPRRYQELDLPEPDHASQLVFTAKRTRKFLKKVAHTDKSSMGIFGWSGRLIKLVSGALALPDSPPFFHLLADFIARLANGLIPQVTAFALTASDMIGLHKLSRADQAARALQGLKPKLRAIMIGVGLLKWALKMVVQSLPVSKAAKDMMDFQLGLSAKRGTERFAHLYRALYLKRFAIFAVDAENAFYTTERQRLIDAIALSVPSVLRVFITYYGIKNPVFYYISPEDVQFLLNEQGVRAGCSLGSFGFDTCVHPVFRALPDLPSEKEQTDKLVVKALTDDFPMGVPPPSTDDPQLVRAFYVRIANLYEGASTLLAKHTGGSFNLSKCVLLLHPDIPPPPADLHFPFTITRDGLVLGGAPIGTDDFVQAHFQTALADFTSKCTRLTDLHSQVALRLLKDSLIPAYQHPFRLTPPALVQHHATQFDQAVETAVHKILEPPERPAPVPCSTSRQLIANKVMHMPVKSGGLGLKSFKLLSTVAFFSSLVCCITEEDEGLREHADALAPAITDAHNLIVHQLTAHGNFAAKAYKILPPDPLTALRPEFYTQVLSATTHLQSSLSDVIEDSQRAAIKQAVLDTKDTNAQHMSDWMSLFSHGSDRSSCLFGRLTDLGNRFEAHDFVDYARWVLLLPQLPHLFNEEKHPNYDYHIGKCQLDRHAKTGPPLSGDQQMVDLHGDHARSNCAKTKAGVATAHTGLKQAVATKAIMAGMVDTNEPTHETLLGTFTADACSKLFPEKTCEKTAERACHLIQEAFHIKSLPHDQTRQRLQAAFDSKVATLPRAKGARLDVMLKSDPSAAAPTLWLDVATVHPLAHSNKGRERARALRDIAEFTKDPAAAAPPHLRTQPSLSATVNYKKIKYRALLRAAALQSASRSKRARAPVFVPLVVTTLGQVHGLHTVSAIMTAAYLRKLEILGPRSDGDQPATLAASYKRDLRQSLLAAAAKGFAQSLRAAGLPYSRTFTRVA